MKVQAHIIFTGIVQGVGFRYTTQRIADELGLTGWVKNLSDGRVEIIVEGAKDQIEVLINHLDAHFSGSIQNKAAIYYSASDKFQDFRVV